ncbi:MAG: hypothetical protein FD180_1892 [Planctomycetota bacterium]|nr:MAG: hypothetical protein FD180_1892 [Planctomycetota bacterium]
MTSDRIAAFSAACILGIAGAASALVWALREPSRPAKNTSGNAAVSPDVKPSPGSVGAPSPETPPERVDNPLRPDPALSPRLQAEQDRLFREHFAAARLLLDQGRFRDAEFEIRALLEQRPEKNPELKKELDEIARLALAALEEAVDAAKREPARARTVLASLAARVSDEIAKEANRELQEIEDRRAGEEAGKKAAEAEKLAGEGKLREEADALDAAAEGLPGNEAAGVKARAEFWRRLARYAGAMDAAELMQVEAATLDEVEPLVEEFLIAEDPDKRNTISQKLQTMESVTPALVAALILRGGKFNEIASRDYVESYPLPGGEKREICISVPEDYKPDRLWPVFMNLHGTNATIDYCRQYAPYLRSWARGRFIVVQPASARKSGWGPMMIGEQQGPAALQYVRAKFPIDPDRIWLAGQSMGAHGTWHQAMRHGDLYAAYLPKAGSPYGAYGKNWKEYLDNLRLSPSYFIHGALDPMFPIKTPRAFAEIAKEQKLNVDYHEFANSGHEGAPDDEIQKSFEWATDKVRVPYPKKFAWTADYLDAARLSWVEVTRLDARVKCDNVQFVDQEKKPVESRSVMQEPARFQVEVKGQTIELKTKHITKIRVFWNPAVVDLTKDVVVKSNGKSKWKGVPALSIRQMLDEARRTGRRDVVFYGSVEIDAP